MGWQLKDDRSTASELTESQRNIVRALLLAIRAKDDGTFSHCCRVGQTSRRLAQAAGLSADEQRLAEFSGVLHDIGKIVVPDAILHKPGRLDQSEMEIMKQHPVVSAQMVEPFTKDEFFASLLPGVLSHHERIDGQGYPNGLKADNIPLMARIVLVADTYDAMTMDRHYRLGLPSERAVEELKTFAGTQFDAYLVRIFVDALPFWLRRDHRPFSITAVSPAA